MRATMCLVTVLVLAFVGNAIAEDAVATIDTDLFIGKALVVENVTVWPVYSKKELPKLGEFVTLQDAQKDKLAQVRELGAGAAAGELTEHARQENIQQEATSQRGAAVNELVIDNKGDKAILVLAGTLVKGGNQDRQIAQDFVIPPGKTVSVDAFCVEHGRWTASREGKDTKGVFEAQQSLTTSSVRNAAQNASNQSEVWNKVAQENKNAGKSPESGTYQAIVEETDKGAVERRGRLQKAIQQKFADLEKSGERPLGIAYAVDGKVREIRSFAQPEIFTRYQEILSNTVAIEGDLAQRTALEKKEKVYDRAADNTRVTELAKQIQEVKAETSKTKAGNINMTKRAKDAFNNDCYMEGKDQQPVTRNWSAAE